MSYQAYKYCSVCIRLLFCVQLAHTTIARDMSCDAEDAAYTACHKQQLRHTESHHSLYLAPRICGQTVWVCTRQRAVLLCVLTLSGCLRHLTEGVELERPRAHP